MAKQAKGKQSPVSAADLKKKLAEELAASPYVREKVDRFSQWMLTYTQQLVNTCQTAATSLSKTDCGTLSDRYKRGRVRARAKVRPSTDTRGNVLRNAEDGHAIMNYTNGWCASAIRVLKSWFAQRLLHSQETLFRVLPIGRKEEWRTLRRTIKGVIADQFYSSPEVEKTMERAFDRVAKYPVSVVRCESVYTQGLNGPRLRHRITAWPVEDVFVSNLDCPNASGQSVIVWITRDVTLRDLEADERKGSVGSFRNLDQVRKHIKDLGEPTAGSQSNRLEPMCMKVEIEGSLPVRQMAEHGRLDYDTLEQLGAAVGTAFDPGNPEKNEPGDLEGRARWESELGAVSQWKLTYITEPSYNPDSPSPIPMPKFLLQLQVNPFGRNTAYVFRYTPDEYEGSDGKETRECFYGLSPVDLGFRIENMADALWNQEFFVWNRNRSLLFVRTGMVKGIAPEKVPDMLMSGQGVVELKENPQIGMTQPINPSEVSAPLNWPTNPLIVQQTAFAKEAFDKATGISSSAAGQGSAPQTGTATELQQNYANSSALMNDSTQCNGAEMARILKDILLNTILVYGDGFPKYAAGVSGVGESEIAAVMPSLLGIQREVRLVHPFIGYADPIQIFGAVERLVKLLPEVAIGHQEELFDALCDVMGMAGPLAVMSFNEKMLPQDEQQQMRSGNYIEPNQTEDFVQHLGIHNSRLAELVPIINSPAVTEEDLLEAKALSTHIPKTMEMMKTAIQMMQAQQVMAEAQGQGEEEQGPGATKREPGPTTARKTKPNPQPREGRRIKTGPQMQNEIETQNARVPAVKG